MNRIINMVLVIGMVVLLISGCNSNDKDTRYLGKGYTMPDEAQIHEGTWLQWPHDYTYGTGYREDMKDIWVEMTRLLSEGENVHIVAYNDNEKNYITKTLLKEGVDLERIDFYIHHTDDVWARDNGPIFVYDENQNLKLLDWGFNGWGEKTPFTNDDQLREKLGLELDIEVISLKEMVLEGGAIELDGAGSLLSTRSAVTNKNRNPDLSEDEIEEYLSKYYGVKNFIWLDGVPDLDITDFHIDGFAKFYDESTIITLENEDLIEWGVSHKDIDTLMNAKNAFDDPYEYVFLPLSENNVVLDNGKNLGYKGSYVNFYIANEVVLVPNYNDPNDQVANDIIQSLYPNRNVVGIDVRELYQYGGMIHCVTQQQPIDMNK